MEDHVAIVAENLARHRPTAVATEIRALEAQLLLVGPMKRPTLAQAVRADSWSVGTFDEAVAQAVREGKILELPLNWFRAARR
jgi:hypothetical protein